MYKTNIALFASRDDKPAAARQESPQPSGRPRSRFRMTDSGNAELFALIFKDRLRFNHSIQRWLVWQTDWWAVDGSGEVVRLVKEAARMRHRDKTDYSEEEGSDRLSKWSRQSEGLYRINAVLRIAQSEPPLSDDGKDWNADPMLLGVNNGVVELKTGKLRRGRQSDRITLHTDIAFDPEAQCPRWSRFVNEVFGGDQELVEYVHKAVGYSMTGSTKRSR